jgi:hypothetical protein
LQDGAGHRPVTSGVTAYKSDSRTEHGRQAARARRRITEHSEAR